ncbi:DNA primase [Azospirillum brasilense]|uniref:DNA primase n=1 Tax=Azospirillum brasilense TaxID=192 RepID=UPI0003AAC2FE|nr:DNA primase [Azospirillum brasilense]
MAFPPQFLEELRTRLALSDVVGKRLRLIRAGREYKAPCPFHNEKSPSFYVNDQKGFFHCFGCGAHGDIIGFVMRHDNLAFPEAVEALAGEAGLPVPRATEEDKQRYERRKTLHDLVEQAARWFEQQLYAPAGRAGLEYFQRRGLDTDGMARFRLGFAPGDSGALRSQLLKQGFSEEDMVTAGLLKRPEDGRTPYSFFRNRVIFPVTDRRGRVVAFGGRILEGDGPKYVNTADTPLFHKGTLLYGLSRARQAAADGKPVIVAEGYMDVIALVRAGFEGAVAPLGTALTETQVQELWKLIPDAEKVPFLCFDGDNAGRRAAWRAVERILPHLAPGHSGGGGPRQPDPPARSPRHAGAAQRGHSAVRGGLAHGDRGQAHRHPGVEGGGESRPGRAGRTDRGPRRAIFLPHGDAPPRRRGLRPAAAPAQRARSLGSGGLLARRGAGGRAFRPANAPAHAGPAGPAHRAAARPPPPQPRQSGRCAGARSARRDHQSSRVV